MASNGKEVTDAAASTTPSDTNVVATNIVANSETTPQENVGLDAQSTQDFRSAASVASDHQREEVFSETPQTLLHLADKSQDLLQGTRPCNETPNYPHIRTSPPIHQEHEEEEFQRSHRSTSRHRSHESHGSSLEDDKVKLTKGFKLIMDAKNPDCFDGKSRAQYLPWKVALQSEVSHLPLTSIQWLDLLKARTKGEAREAVDRAYKIWYEAGPDHTLDAAWKYLEHL